jgi:choline kinase
MSSYIILSAGIGRTMKTLGSRSLLNINGNIVLEHQVKTIRSADSNADILVVTGHQSKKVLEFSLKKDLDVRIIQNQNYETSDQCDSLILGINATALNDLYVIHGDIIFNKESLKGPLHPYVIVDKHISNKKAVGLCHQDGILRNMAFGLEDKWGQIIYINSPFFKTAKMIAQQMAGKATYEWINVLTSKIEIGIHSIGVKTKEISKGHESIDSI